MIAVETTYLLVAAALATIVAYTLYFKDLVWGETHPNRWSWLIWSGATLVEAMTYQEVSGDWLKSGIFFLSALSCMVITIAVWIRAKWEWPSTSELLCLVASIAALVLWLIFGLTLMAHLIMVAAVPVAFIPTWTKVLENPANEKSYAWMLWSIGDFIMLWIIVSRLQNVDELPFITAEFICHFLTWRLVARRATLRGPKH